MRLAKKNKAFSLIELLIIIAIAGIMASVLIVNLLSSRQDAKDQNVWAVMSITPESAYRCLKRNLDNVHLNNPWNYPANICVYGTDLYLADLPEWPIINVYGWSYDSHSGTSRDNFWCQIGSTATPPSSCAQYNNTDCGGSSSSGRFCYKVCDQTDCGNNPRKVIWCTENGCQKSGF